MHALTMNKATGKAEHAFAGIVGWHGHGQQMPDDATIQQWASESNMTFTLCKSMVQYMLADGTMRQSDKQVIYRSDNGDAVGFVSDDYEIVQPAELFQFMGDLATDAGYKMETCGTLFGGRKMWAQAKVGTRVIHGDDIVHAYLLFSTSADGSRCTEIRETSQRVVCQNTLNMAFGAASGKVIQVSHRTKFDAAKVKAQILGTADRFENFADTMRDLANVPVTALDAADFIRRLLRPDDSAKAVAKAAKMVAATGGDDSLAALLAKPATLTGGESVLEKAERAPKGEKALFDLFTLNAIGIDKPGANGTLWGLLNAVTEHVDHHATAKTTSHLIDSAQFGKGDALKTRALNMAVEMMHG